MHEVREQRQLICVSLLTGRRNRQRVLRSEPNLCRIHSHGRFTQQVAPTFNRKIFLLYRRATAKQTARTFFSHCQTVAPTTLNTFRCRKNFKFDKLGNIYLIYSRILQNFQTGTF